MPSNSSKIEFTISEYVSALCTEVLGPHYKLSMSTGIPNGIESEFGFIYCECYLGKNFKLGSPYNMANAIEKRYYPGATARIEPATLILLDQRLRFNHSNESWGEGYADLERVSMYQPNFLEKFKTIPVTHDKVCERFNVSKEWRM